MTDQAVISWLLEGDVSIQYQVHRDMLGHKRLDLQRRITQEGWGARYLECRNADGTWGRGFYQPKWTCSHYTLLDLRSFEASPDTKEIRQSIERIAQEEIGPDGGVNPSGTIKHSDVCINGMFLRYACYFGIDEALLKTVVDFILSQIMEDGGFNCRRNRSGARHSSLHSTLCVMEGLWEHARQGYRYRSGELAQAVAGGREFILQHRLYKSDHTGEMIHRDMIRLVHPARWKYNILRCLDGFVSADEAWDERMTDALEVLLAKRKRDGRWNVEAAHPGQTHVVLERAGAPSRWITMMALHVLGRYGDRVRRSPQSEVDKRKNRL